MLIPPMCLGAKAGDMCVRYAERMSDEDSATPTVPLSPLNPVIPVHEILKPDTQERRN